MALPATGVLEIRSGGSSTNGGGFVAGGAGTDWSQQNAAQYSVTDGVAAGTTTLTSATAAFGTDVVDNYVYVQGGTGSITAGWSRIVSRTSATAIVVDRSTGLTAGTGVTLKIGGALASLANLSSSNLVAGNTVYIKTTSGYTTAATITLSIAGGDGTPIQYVGYTTTRGDGGQAVVTSTNAAATSLISATGARATFKNITADGASLSLRAFSASGTNVHFENCWGKGATQYGFRSAGTGIYWRRCLATGNGSSGGHAGFVVDAGTGLADRCVSRDNGGNGFSSLTAGQLTTIDCIAHGNTLSGWISNDTQSELFALNCTSYGNTLDGVRFAAASTFEGSTFRDCIFYGNAGYGMRSITTDYSGVAAWISRLENNAFGANTLGARFQVPTGAADITLTQDPFADAASDDFALNMIEGGGLALRAAGVPGGFGLLSTPEPSVGMSDVGAVPSGGSTSSSTGLGTMRGLWYELVGEKDTDVVPFTVCDMYLQRGLEELNRLVRYHYTDDATAITLVAATQEYALPAACNQLVFVTWRGQELKKSSVDQWRSQGEPWQQQSGEPREWAMYGEKLVIFPTPTVEAVAADPNPVLRYGSNPPDIGTAGPEQLREQDYPIPVYHGVALWSASYPDSAAAQMRLQYYEALFDKETGKISEYYSARSVTR